MPGPIRPDKTRKTVVIWQSTHAWLVREGERLGVTASDVVRGAIDHLRTQPEHVRAVVIRAAANEREEEPPMAPRR